jgi:hypothetical protein
MARNVIVKVDSSIILFRPFRAQENLMVHDPGALPLAIRFHAFSVKRKPAKAGFSYLLRIIPRRKTAGLVTFRKSRVNAARTTLTAHY